MGLNTAALILNDALHSIRDDDMIGDKIDRQVNLVHRDGGDVTARGARSVHVGAIQILPSQHADYVQIVAVGGNCIRRLASSAKWEPEDLLRDLAQELGFTLRRKPKPPSLSSPDPEAAEEQQGTRP